MLSVYSPKETFLKKLICAVADGASVNFGHHQGALTKLSEMIGWDLSTLHGFNHKLELAMKDSYTSDKTFTEIKEMFCTGCLKMVDNHGVYTNVLLKP